jgi:hypothetical protein
VATSAFKLEARDAAIFGREGDIASLLKQTASPGITAVIGQPQMGKTWLLTEIARRLATAGSAADIQGPEKSSLVGFVTQTGQTADLLPRAVHDLYIRWLENAGLRQQALAFWKRNRDEFVGRVGESFGALSKAMLSLTAPGGAAIGALVEELFKKLGSAARDERTGGMQSLPILQTEDARDLLQIMYQVTGFPRRSSPGSMGKITGPQQRGCDP